MNNDPTTHEPGADAGAPWEVVEPAATEQAAGPVPTTALAVFDPIEQTLADIEARHKNVVYDLTTTKGNEAARKARQELVSARTTAEKTYKTWNTPLLAAQKKARELCSGFEKRVLALETPLDKAIKADEERRAAEKKARDDAEAARIKAIRDRIAAIYALPASCVGSPSGEIELVIVGLECSMTDKASFEELQGEAEAAADVVLTKLQAMMSAAKASEEQAARLAAEAVRQAAERAELERQRAEFAAQQEAARVAAEQAEAARLAAIAAEAARVANERAIQEAADRQRAADVAERDRLAQEAIDAAARQAAERLAEQQRQLDEQRAAFEAEQLAARKAKQEAEDAELERKLEEAKADDQRKADLVNAEMRAAMDAMPIAPALARSETVSASGATIVQYEPARPAITEQADAFEAERQAEAARAAALPKPTTKRPDDERLTAAVARAFDVEPAIAAEWLGTYDAFEEIARLQGAPA